MGYLPYQLVSRIFSPSTVWIPKIAIVSRTYLFQTIGALYGLSHCSPPLHTLAETGYENKIFQTLFLTSMKMHSRVITTPPISTAHIQINQECSSITISFFRPRENLFMIHHSFGSKFDQRIREYHIHQTILGIYVRFPDIYPRPSLILFLKWVIMCQLSG